MDGSDDEQGLGLKIFSEKQTRVPRPISRLSIQIYKAWMEKATDKVDVIDPVMWTIWLRGISRTRILGLLEIQSF